MSFWNRGRDAERAARDETDETACIQVDEDTEGAPAPDDGTNPKRKRGLVLAAVAAVVVVAIGGLGVAGAAGALDGPQKAIERIIASTQKQTDQALSDTPEASDEQEAPAQEEQDDQQADREQEQTEQASADAASGDQVAHDSPASASTGSGAASGGSSISSSGSSNSGSASAPTPAPVHVHDWVPITEQRWVQESPAWDGPERAGSYIQCSCGLTFNTVAEWSAHDRATGAEHSYTVLDKYVTVHHEATGHYDTVTIGYRCSTCGATK